MQSSRGIFKFGGMGSAIGFDLQAVGEIIKLYKFHENTVLDLVLSVEADILQTLREKSGQS